MSTTYLHGASLHALLARIVVAAIPVAAGACSSDTNDGYPSNNCKGGSYHVDLGQDAGPGGNGDCKPACEAQKPSEVTSENLSCTMDGLEAGVDSGASG